ncbi:uncharacterized protein MONOS_14700 [Monocercomonoides exilis]|uniref:uncharacterized protein n=1 Tax=Monocercomonoides exilis TaxID=2049356 RepID=UPI00355AC207|nr:hypothetical protein MONOS_14700 [Monocercomonoides exilis]|eukprot:MONOS_14700.1-p1 / transcript=MONOS_14700.1 / gene=MONOS_14700 / organism=Monocercomonoides_exilis_PA203 / gene_product=unspecified product / transcript_product=unspecified product / location=Mono_scaffold01054:5942-6259(-) / protein_length=106 / sequence_SO=supercontig / SO=protein_coding / is_pseudo=false
MYREKEEAHEAEQEEEYMWMYALFEREEGLKKKKNERKFSSYFYIIYLVNRLVAPLICKARDGGRGGGRQGEGTSGATLCIGDVETEEDEELTMGGVLQWKETEK